MIIERPIKKLIAAVVMIKTQNNGNTHGTGTGFIVTHKNKNFLVTNKHVIDNAIQCTLYFAGKKDPVNTNEKEWYKNIDFEKDVAILPLSDICVNETIETFLTEQLLPANNIIENFYPIEDIIFIGYPIGIYDDINNQPIARKGITATPFNLNYKGKPAFLIDASVFPGSSGSPVFLAEGTITFLGLLSQAIYDGNNFTNITTIPSTTRRSPLLINLGKVIKASVVFETINEFIENG